MTMESARDLFLHDARSMYGGTRRLERGLPKVEERVGEMQLTNLIRELQAASGEQAKRLEEVFELVDERAKQEASPVIDGFLQEASTLSRERPVKQVGDVFIAETASGIARHCMQTFQGMLQIAEQAGITTAVPRVGDALEVCVKEHKKLSKDLQKLTEKLIGQMRPS